MCLENSKTSGLDVRLLSGCPEAFFEALQPHVSRIDSMSCLLTLKERDRLYPFLQDVPAPRLRRLSIKSIIHDTSSLPLLFRGHVPSLQHIRLSGVPLGNAWKHVRTLLNLELDNAPNSASGMTDFLDFLELNTTLQQIHITSAGPLVEDGDPTRLVSLPNLRMLELTDCAAKEILSHVTLPPGADLVIQDLQMLGNFKEALPPSIDHLENTLHLERIGIWNIDGNHCSTYGTGPNGTFTIKTKDNARAHYSLLTKKCLYPSSVFCVDDVNEIWLKNVRLGIPPDPQKSSLYGFFSYLTMTATLVLLESRGDSILQHLQPIGDQVLCPALTNLILYDVDRLKSDVLIELARTRKEHGYPLRKISLIYRPGKLWIPAEDVMSLKAYVNVVKYMVDDQGPKAPGNWFSQPPSSSYFPRYVSYLLHDGEKC
jgi:hypothetical protein